MKPFLACLLIIILVCSGCSGFQYRIDQPLPTAKKENTAVPLPSTPVPVANAEVIPQPTLFQSRWNDPNNYSDSVNSSQRNLLPGWLPRSEYLIDVTISSDLKKIDGKSEILAINHSLNEIQQLILHFYPVLFGSPAEIFDVSINGKPVRAILSKSSGLLTVPLENPLAAAEAVVLSLSFSYTMPADSSSNYLIFGNSPGQVTLAHFYPMLAALDEDGWHTDTPPNYGDVTYSDPAMYQVRVRAPADVVIAASGLERYSEKDTTNQLREFAIGPAHDFFLGAAKGYKTFKKQTDTVQIRCIAAPPAQEGCRQAMNLAADSLAYFSGLIGPYPYPEFTIMATHTTALGVEYPGVIAINQELMNVDAGSPDIQQTKYLSSTIVHEVGHQWFYNLIGNDQINQPWVDESTTQYITYLYFQMENGQNAGSELLNSFKTRADRVDDQTIQIGKPVAAYSPQEYSAVIYGKGPLFLHAIQDQIGLEAMQDFLSTMFQRYEWQNVSTTEMEQELEIACHCELDSAFAEWVGPSSE